MRATRAPTTRVNRTGGAAMAALGVLLAAVALPIAGGELASRPGAPVLRELRTGEGVSAPGLTRLEAAAEAALTWREAGPAHATLGLVALHRAARAREPVPLLNRAAEQLRRSLRRAPASPHTWARLARTRYRLGLPASEVAAALRRSLATGANVPRLAAARADMALRLWPALDRDGRWRREIARGWRRRPASLTRTATAVGRSGVLGRAVTGIAR